MTENRFGSPLWLTDELQRYFGKFTLDMAAEPWSALVPNYITKEQDVFRVKPVTDHGFGNWPYGPGQLLRFVPFARESVVEGRVQECTQLVPHYTAEGWWRFVMKPEGKVKRAEWRYDWIGHPRLKNWTRYFSERLVIDIIEVQGRLSHRFPPRYDGARAISRHSSVVVRFLSPEAA